MGGISRFTPQERAELALFDAQVDLEFSQKKHKLQMDKPHKSYSKRPAGMTQEEYERNYRHQYYLDHKKEFQAYFKNRTKKKAAIRRQSDNSTQENI